MANVRLKGIGYNQFGGVEECGNLTSYRSRLATNALGAALNANSAVALAIGDVVYLNTLPAGMVLQDCCVVVSNAFSANVTASLGFVYADGIDRTDVPQDPAYFGAGIALNAVARIRNASTKTLVRLPKEAFLVMTIAGAANAEAGVADVIVEGERLGE